jgi:hypothetical protein
MVTVYILEAHADDEWPISSARFSADGRAVHVLQPRSNHGRCQLARRFVADFDFPETLVLVDPCDQGNPFEAAYAPWPLRFYGIAGEGRMGYVAHPRDCSYDLPALRDWALSAAAGLEMGPDSITLEERKSEALRVHA